MTTLASIDQTHNVDCPRQSTGCTIENTSVKHALIPVIQPLAVLARLAVVAFVVVGPQVVVLAGVYGQ